jgi:hypothetical protein
LYDLKIRDFARRKVLALDILKECSAYYLTTDAVVTIAKAAQQYLEV